ncbi:MAG: type II toxin-antitoxin system prevent-host-death family antitoxin [Oceanicaulis sp.]
MKIDLSDAEGRLLDLVRRAEAGEDVLLTRDGAVVARISVGEPPAKSPEERRALIKRVQESARRHALEGPDAARSQDFLYDEDGLPK